MDLVVGECCHRLAEAMIAAQVMPNIVAASYAETETVSHHFTYFLRLALVAKHLMCITYLLHFWLLVLNFWIEQCAVLWLITSVCERCTKCVIKSCSLKCAKLKLLIKKIYWSNRIEILTFSNQVTCIWGYYLSLGIL